MTVEGEGKGMLVIHQEGSWLYLERSCEGGCCQYYEAIACVKNLQMKEQPESPDRNPVGSADHTAVAQLLLGAS